VHASHIRPREDAQPAEYADVPLERLPDERKLWPPPAERPDGAWPDRSYVGVLDGGELPLPPGLRRFGEQGLEAAHQLERNLDGTTGVVVYAHDRQHISGAGINVVALRTSEAAFRYPYTGLRLLGRSADGGYVLLPRWWTRTDGNPAYVLPAGSGIRVDLLALPLD
jgi:hypothetical protein